VLVLVASLFISGAMVACDRGDVEEVRGKKEKLRMSDIALLRCMAVARDLGWRAHAAHPGQRAQRKDTACTPRCQPARAAGRSGRKRHTHAFLAECDMVSLGPLSTRAHGTERMGLSTLLHFVA